MKDPKLEAEYRESLNELVKIHNFLFPGPPVPLNTEPPEGMSFKVAKEQNERYLKSKLRYEQARKKYYEQS